MNNQDKIVAIFLQTKSLDEHLYCLSGDKEQILEAIKNQLEDKLKGIFSPINSYFSEILVEAYIPNNIKPDSEEAKAYRQFANDVEEIISDYYEIYEISEESYIPNDITPINIQKQTKINKISNKNKVVAIFLRTEFGYEYLYCQSGSKEQILEVIKNTIEDDLECVCEVTVEPYIPHGIALDSEEADTYRQFASDIQKLIIPLCDVY